MRTIRFLNKVMCLAIVQLLLLCPVSCYKNTDLLYNEDCFETVYDGESSDPVICEEEVTTYILNIKSKKIHKVTCGTGGLIMPQNRGVYEGDIKDLYDRGYTECGNCFK